ncbi:Uncharacterised protein [Mycobacteroides abscessus]|nr:Uncharacterised protein [Mycobacteroides abscessus]
MRAPGAPWTARSRWPAAASIAWRCVTASATASALAPVTTWSWPTARRRELRSQRAVPLERGADHAVTRPPA